MSKNILIIGAGPAGLIAAIELAKGGIRATVLDGWSRGQVDARGNTKLCGGGLTPKALQLLPDLKMELSKNFEIVYKTIGVKTKVNRKGSIDLFQNPPFSPKLVSGGINERNKTTNKIPAVSWIE